MSKIVVWCKLNKVFRLFDRFVESSFNGTRWDHLLKKSKMVVMIAHETLKFNKRIPNLKHFQGVLNYILFLFRFFREFFFDTILILKHCRIHQISLYSIGSIANVFSVPKISIVTCLESCDLWACTC